MGLSELRAAVAVLGTVAALSGRAFVLTPETRIVVPDPENVGLAWAIDEAGRALAYDLERGSGRKVPVVTASKAGNGTNTIFIGGGFAEKAGLMPTGADALKEFENVIAAKDGDLYLFGADLPGHKSAKRLGWTECVLPSVKATCNFMEQDLGIRFLYPGKVGRDVPKIEKVEVADGTFRRHTPKMNCGNGRCFEMMYSVANNILGSGLYKSHGGHIYPAVFPVEKYYKDHPEYYALVGDGRQCARGNPAICFSEPAVEDLLVAEIAREFDAGYSIVELGQNDGGTVCQCEKCRTYAGTGPEDGGEKFWILHKRVAERLLRTHPDKIVLIASYGRTYQPPKTFKEFPANVMIELMNSAPKSLRLWKEYRVPHGFTTYLYTFGTYQLPGYTALPAVATVAQDARRIVDYGIRAVYRCGYGEKFGMEGPASYVFNKLLDNPEANENRLAEEFCDRAFGPAATAMKRFYELLDLRLRGVNKMREGYEQRGDTVAVVNCQTRNASDVFAYVYTTDVLRGMENLLSRAERNPALTDLQKKRLELVRLEFDYAVKIAKVAHLYSAYRLNPTAEFFAPLGAAVKDRRAYVESLYDERGRVRKLDGWPELNVFAAAPKRTLLANGYLQAILQTPFGWDVDFMQKNGILPGSGVKRTTVRRTTEKPSAEDFEKGAWARASWHTLGGLQLEKLTNETKFKILYDDENLYLAIDSTLADGISVPSFGRDGETWAEEAIEILIDPFGEREKFYHFIYNPADDSAYDAAFGFIDWPEDPLYGQDDPHWNGDWTYVWRRGNDKWRSLVTIPFRTLGVKAPEAGMKMCLNVAREGGVFGQRMSRSNPEIGVWSPNLESRSLISRDALGEIVFE